MVHLIPPDEMTVSTLTVVEQRIQKYYRINGTLPPDLNNLPVIPEKDNVLGDGWEHPLKYTRQSDTVCHIRSLGADGKLGGTGDNSDVVRTVKIENP